MFYKKRCSEKFHKIHRKTPVPESLFFNKSEKKRKFILKKAKQRFEKETFNQRKSTDLLYFKTYFYMKWSGCAHINHTLRPITPNQISHYTYAMSLSFLQNMNKLMTSTSLKKTISLQIF